MLSKNQLSSTTTKNKTTMKANKTNNANAINATTAAATVTTTAKRTAKRATKAPQTISIKEAVSRSREITKNGTDNTGAAPAIVPAKQAQAKQLTPKQQEAQQRRRELSNLCSKLQEAAGIAGVGVKPNELLRKYYKQEGHTELRTFEEWKKAGYYVRKGEKAILLWGRPKPSRHAKEEAAQAGIPEEQAKNDFYPLAYLFSNRQVAQRK